MNGEYPQSAYENVDYIDTEELVDFIRRSGHLLPWSITDRLARKD